MTLKTKTVIHENGSDDKKFQVIAELIEPDMYSNLHCLRISTKWSAAKEPSYEQKKGELFLSKEELVNLAKFLDDCLK